MNLEGAEDGKAGRVFAPFAGFGGAAGKPMLDSSPNATEADPRTT